MYKIFNIKVGLVFKLKEAMQSSVIELLIEAGSMVDVWFVWQSANTQVCVQVYHYSNPNTDLRGYKLNQIKP